jgi:hypothetical protein
MLCINWVVSFWRWSCKNGLEKLKNMTHKVIKTEAAYQKAVKRTIAIFEAKEDTAEANELAVLLL